jgi:CheY-like chemotaxis protein
MDGLIGVDSSEGAGSVFWFELPLAEAMSPLRVEDVPSKAPSRPSFHVMADSTILYVEDNPANLQLVQKILLRYPNLTLLTASDGLSGIDIAIETKPAAVLLDINLPGINGFEVIELLKTNPITAGIPVIALTASAMPSDLERGRKAGFFRYLTKPIIVEELLETVSAALEVARASAPGSNL